jgi:uncharacterized protein YaiE (UPF0345 family)
VDVTGNLLVGSTSAVGNANANDLELTNSGGSGVVGMTFNVNSGSANTGNIYWRSNASNNAIQISGDPITNYLAFSTSGAEKMRIDSSGNVGINTSSPTLDGSLAGLSVNASGTVLQVNDGDGATLKLTDPATGANRGLGITLQGTSAAISNCESGELRFGTGNTERMRIDSGGITTVGGTTGAGRLNAIASNWSENALAVYSANVAAQTNFAGMGFFNQDADSPIAQVADIYTNPTGTLSLTASGNPAIQLKYGSFGISGGTAALTVDSSGFVGIGNTAPDTALDVASSGVPIEIRSTNDNTYKIQVGGSSGYHAYWGTTSSAPFIVANSSVSEMMRIDSSGNVLVGKTAGSNTTKGSTLTQTGEIVSVITTAGGASQNVFLNRQDATGTAILFRYANGTVGSIDINASSVSYNTSSDYRLKENITDADDAGSKIDAIQD